MKLQLEKTPMPWMAARTALHSCVERLEPGLFDRIDTTELHGADNLDSIMETTERIDYVVLNHRG
jgi:hypothetical protein